MQHHVPLHSGDRESRQNKFLRRIEVPAIIRDLLVVPRQRTVRGVNGYDRTRIELLAPLAAFASRIERRHIGGAHENEIGLLTGAQTVPNISAAARSPIVSGIP